MYDGIGGPPDERRDGLPDPRVTPTVTVARTARLLGVSRSTAYSAVRRGQIPTIRVGNRILVPTVAIYRLLDLPLPGMGIGQG